MKTDKAEVSRHGSRIQFVSLPRGAKVSSSAVNYALGLYTGEYEPTEVQFFYHGKPCGAYVLDGDTGYFTRVLD